MTALRNLRQSGLRRLGAAAAAVSLCAGVSILDTGTAAAANDSAYVVSTKINVGSDPQGVAIDPLIHKVFVVDNASNTVSVIDESGDANRGKVTATINLGGNDPTAIAVDLSTHVVYVVDLSNNTVSAIDESGDANSGKVTSTINLPGVGYITAMAVDPVTHDVYVVAHGPRPQFSPGTVSEIDESGDATTGQVTATLTTPGEPNAIAIDPSTHNLYVVANQGERDMVSVIDESGDANTGRAEATIDVAVSGLVPQGAGIDPSTHHVFVTNPAGVSVIDTLTNRVIAVVTDPSGPTTSMAVDPSSHDLYVTNSDNPELTVVDESGDINNGRIVGSLGLDAPLTGIALDPATHNLYVADPSGGKVLVLIPSARIGGVVSDKGSGKGIAGACVQVETASAGVSVARLVANSRGAYTGTVAPGSYKLLASDCVGGTHVPTYFGGAANYDFTDPQAQAVTTTSGSAQTNLDVALPLAGTISGVVTAFTIGQGSGGICGYAIDATTNQLRGFSAPSATSGRYTIGQLPAGVDRVAFQGCTTNPAPFYFSDPVTVVAGGVTTLNYTISQF